MATVITLYILAYTMIAVGLVVIAYIVLCAICVSGDKASDSEHADL